MDGDSLARPDALRPGQPQGEDVPPDWGSIEFELHCPLCGYNLRGLETPRCPECGYRFAWKGLIEARENRHPYLFEHHPGHNVWSFSRTLVGGIRPSRFWSRLTAAHEVAPRRLTAYAIIVTLAVLFLGSAWMLAAIAVTQYRFNSDQRAWWVRGLVNPDPTQITIPDGRLMSDMFAREYPLPPQPRFFIGVIRNSASEPTLRAVALLAAWPWLTLLSLNFFYWSMSRANVYPRHVFRCVVYSGDALVWIPVIWLALTGVVMLIGGPGAIKDLFDPRGAEGITAFVALGMFALIVVATWRLGTAYRRYLRFPHPIATVLASQVIVGLTLFTFFMYWIVLRM